MQVFSFSDCNQKGNASLRIRNIGTDINEITITRTSPTVASVTTISPTTIIKTSETAIIYDEGCGTGNLCSYEVSLPDGYSMEIYAQC